MSRFIFLFITLIIPFITSAQSAWKNTFKDDQCTIKTRTTKDNLFEFKATTTINQSVEKVLAILTDYKSYPKWSYKTKAVKVLERINENKHYNYTVIDFPFPLKDRDVITLSTTTKRPDKSILISLVAKPDKIAQSDDYVRMQNVRGFWLLKPLSDQKTELTYQFASESMGMPTWLIESFALESPKHNLTKIRERAGK